MVGESDDRYLSDSFLAQATRRPHDKKPVAHCLSDGLKASMPVGDISSADDGEEEDNQERYYKCGVVFVKGASHGGFKINEVGWRPQFAVEH